MPRPNPTRDVLTERHLARRIAYERATAGMSLEGLAKRMTNVGCSIHASAIYKIETADPPRRITVSELVAFSQVFGIPVSELLLPPEAAASREAAELLTHWHESKTALWEAQRQADESLEHLLNYVASHPEVSSELKAVVSDWSRELTDDRERANLMMTLMSDIPGTLDDAPYELVAAVFSNLPPALAEHMNEALQAAAEEHDERYGDDG